VGVRRASTIGRYGWDSCCLSAVSRAETAAPRSAGVLAGEFQPHSAASLGRYQNAFDVESIRTVQLSIKEEGRRACH